MMENYIVKTNGSWDTLRKISDITEIQIIDSIEFEIAVVFNEHNIEFKDWILDEIKEIEGVESISSKDEVDKYSKIYHIQHHSNKLETLCGINGRLGLKVDFCSALKNDSKKLCKDCVEMMNELDYSSAVNTMCDNNMYFDDEEDVVDLR
jgi:hypothetical protein